MRRATMVWVPAGTSSRTKRPCAFVNVLIALFDSGHVHHEVAHDWFADNHADGWATCPLTQSGFVRVSSNEKALPDAKTPQEAVLLLRRIVALPHHHFWQDDVSLATSQLFDVTRLTGYRQVTDAHLVTLALHRGGRLATLERKIQSLVPREHAATDVVCAVF